MKVKVSLSRAAITSTNAESQKYIVEVTAVGNKWDSEQFFKHIAKYERLEQKDWSKEYYKSTTP